jgi:hypothetical protein
MSEALILRAQDIIAGKEPHEGAGIATMLEDEIERRGLIKPYIRILVEDIAPILTYDEWENWGDENYTALWSLVRATPEQRARAFLEAVKDKP